MSREKCKLKQQADATAHLAKIWNAGDTQRQEGCGAVGLSFVAGGKANGAATWEDSSAVS